MSTEVNSSKFRISGMTCQGCADTIQQGLINDPNINSAKVVLESKELTIKVDTLQFSFKENYERISDVNISHEEITVEGPESIISSMPDEYNINIEERSSKEVSHIKGIDIKGDISSVKIINEKMNICNPGFDVTPNKYVSKLVTNKGICDATTEGIKSLFK